MHKQAKGRRARQITTDEIRDYKVHPTLNDRAIYSILEGLNSPRSLAVWLLYSNNEHQQLVDLEITPETYLDTHALGRRVWGGPISEFSRDALRFRDDYSATCLLSKAEFLSLDVNPVDAAMKKFFQAEADCRCTNKRLSVYASRTIPLPQFERMLSSMRRTIDSILGEFDPVEWFESCSWGPGATFNKGGKDTGPANKFQNESGITTELYQLVEPLIAAWSPLWGERLAERKYCFTPGNKVTTVKKNAKTDRVIAIEPGLNVFFQLGIGRMISRRLLRHAGIDLSTQERNGLLAFYASLSSLLATVDFSSASDMISRWAAKLLLPPRWYEVMEACRSRHSYVDYGKQDPYWIELEKFSSMGNGFTFPLQALLFFAAAIASVEVENLHFTDFGVIPKAEEHRISSEYVGVFGDDVVLPTAAYKTFTEWCSFLGFSINKSKSFSTGWFRESCGTHYFRGLDVKPLYIKKRLGGLLSVFRLANAVRRLSHRRNRCYGCDTRLRRSWLFLFGSVPKNYRFRISEGFGDGGFVDNFDASVPWPNRPRPVSGSNPGCEGFFTRAVVETPLKRSSESIGLYLSKLFSSSERQEGNEYPLRRATRIGITNRLWVHDWYDLGPWY